MRKGEGNLFRQRSGQGQPEDQLKGILIFQNLRRSVQLIFSFQKTGIGKEGKEGCRTQKIIVVMQQEKLLQIR